jgi:S-(hydroxymethyl)glutathione dehydrogenase/alcohol dehydrogenase
MRRAAAVVLAERGRPPTLEDVSVSGPGRDEVLVGIRASGVCRTDLTAVRDARAVPVVLGHEGAGVVIEVGADVDGVSEGDHVVVNWQPKCGRCRFCVTGRRDLCDAVVGTAQPRVRLRGAPLAVMLGAGTFCRYAVLPAAGAVPVRPDLPFEIAALLGCAVATGVGAALYCARVRPGDVVVVLGAGGVGLNAVQGARLAHARQIIVADVDPDHLALAVTLGATDVVDAAGDIRAAVLDLTGGAGADHVLEAVGAPALVETAVTLLARGGTLTLLGAPARDAAARFLPRTVLSRQQRIQGCIYGSISPERDLPLFADWYLAGQLVLDPLVTRTVPLAAVPELFADHASAGVRTVVTLEEA